MEDAAEYTLDAGQLLSTAAKNYAERAGDAALAAGTAAKVVAITIVGKTLVAGVIVDLTLNDEPVDQAILSQIASAAVGITALAVVPAIGGSLVVAAITAAGFAYGADKLVDLLYPLAKDNLLNKISPLFTTSKSWRPAPSDPFVLDLDGDGIETINVTSGILFDHNADGVKIGTGWVKSDDGLLVRDLNSNGSIDSGRELFGDQTLLANGQIAANGFSALRDLDSNADGVIDASDAAFGELKVWRDLNQDGISQADELQTLGEAGISSIGLTSTTSTTRHNGNAITSLGSYTKADGSTGTTADVNLAINTATTEFSDEVEVPNSGDSIFN